MKMICDVPDEVIKSVRMGTWCGSSVAEKMIANGTPISDNATNGDVIKAIFDTTEEHFYDEDRMVDVYGLDRTDDPSTFYADWWNAPYQKGGTE